MATASEAAAQAWTERDPRYWPAVATLGAVALLLRLFRLGSFARDPGRLFGTHAPIMMHDEAIYSIFSRNFQDYNFDPVYHGPTLYHIIKLVLVLLTDNDFTARLVSVLMGLVTLWLVIGPGRRWMGSRGSLWTLGVLAISPVMVTYQRRILFDSWVALLTLASVLCLQNILSTKPRTERWRHLWIGMAVLTTTFLATKANAFFVVAMLLSFWVLACVREVGPPDLLVRLPAQLPLLLFLIFFATTVIWADRDGDATQIRNKERILWLVGVVCCALLWEWLRRPPLEQIQRRRIKKKSAASSAATDAPSAPALPARLGVEWPVFDPAALAWAVLASAALYGFLFGHGVFWFKEVYEARHAPHFAQAVSDIAQRHFLEIRQAMPRMLAYWSGQQKTPRLPGRHDFYVPLLVAYEWPILVAAACGIFRASHRRTRFTDLLLWWAFTSFVLYSLANEKVPWLAVHVELPLVLLAGWWLGQARFLHSAARGGFAAACVLSAAYLLRNVSATNYERALDNREPMFYAFTSEAFRDTYFKALQVAQQQNYRGDMWIYNAWPTSWYLRDAGNDFPGTTIFYEESLPKTTNPLRLVVCQEADWDKEKNGRFLGFHKWVYDPATDQVVQDGAGENPYILLWPRISWSSLGFSWPIRFDKWVHWFITREAALPAPESDDPFLTEWSHIPVVVATPP